jgi:uncharacterized protein
MIDANSNKTSLCDSDAKTNAHRTIDEDESRGDEPPRHLHNKATCDKRTDTSTPHVDDTKSCCDRTGEQGQLDQSEPVSWAGRIVIFFVNCYRVSLGHVMGGQCRFHPTCSQYMIDAVRKHGFWRGTWRGIKRILRCQPWGGSGPDPA